MLNGGVWNSDNGIWEFQVMIGAGGAEEIIQMGLKPLQMKRFANSVASVQQMVR